MGPGVVEVCAGVAKVCGSVAQERTVVGGLGECVARLGAIVRQWTVGPDVQVRCPKNVHTGLLGCQMQARGCAVCYNQVTVGSPFPDPSAF